MFYSFSRTKVTELQKFSSKKGKGAENWGNRRWPCLYKYGRVGYHCNRPYPHVTCHRFGRFGGGISRRLNLVMSSLNSYSNR